MRWEMHVARMEETINAHKILVGKSEWKRAVGKPRRRCEININVDIKIH
jgi:hypothetical protein